MADSSIECYVPNSLTHELAALGIPNPFAGLRLTRQENVQLFGRAYVGWLRVSDMVTVPDGQELYGRCAESDVDTSLIFDDSGEVSRRPAPPEGSTYAVVQSPTHSRFWQRLEAAVDLQVVGHDFIFSDTFVATYGAPANAIALPEAGPAGL